MLLLELLTVLVVTRAVVGVVEQFNFILLQRKLSLFQSLGSLEFQVI